MQPLLLRFCVLGSALGGGAFVVTRELLAAADAPAISTIAVRLVLGIPFWAVLTAFMAIPVGFVPTCVAAVAYHHLLIRFTSENPTALARALIGAAVGGTASLAFGAALFSNSQGPGAYAFSVNVLSWLAAGIVGGAASALSSRGRTYDALRPSTHKESGA